MLKISAWDTLIAKDNVRQISAAYLPRVDAQAGYTMQLEPQAVIISGRTVETQEPDFAFALDHRGTWAEGPGGGASDYIGFRCARSANLISGEP